VVKEVDSKSTGQCPRRFEKVFCEKKREKGKKPNFRIPISASSDFHFLPGRAVVVVAVVVVAGVVVAGVVVESYAGKTGRGPKLVRRRRKEEGLE
jgi:hypothetical protein